MFVMFITAVCVLLLLKLKWPKNKSFYGGTFFVSCNYNMRDYNIDSSFYSELLQCWDDFRNAFSTLPLTAQNIIWNNKLIKIDGKSIYYHDYVKAGILLTNQMQFDKGSLES